MVFRYNKLRGRIVEKYTRQTAFAQALSEKVGHKVFVQTVNGKLSGALRFTINDVVIWCELLDIPKEEIGIYFFDYELTNDESEK